MPGDLERGFEVQQGVDPVTHGVLHRELAANGVHRVRVVEDSLTQPHQPRDEFGFGLGELPGGVRVGRVDPGAGGQDELQRIQGGVGVLGGAALHAGGVVGHHAANGAGDLACRIGAEFVSIPGQPGVDGTDGLPRGNLHPTSLVEDLDPAEPASRIDEDAVAGGLPGQTGTAGPEGQRGTLTTSVGEQVQDVVDALGPRYLHRSESIMRGVVRHS